MKRRDFLRVAALSPMALSPVSFAKLAETGWRRFELTYQVDLGSHEGAGKLWLPLPQDLGDYQRVMSMSWDGAPGAVLHRDERYGANVLALSWDAAEAGPKLTATTVVATRDRDASAKLRCVAAADQESLYLEPTENMPVDGIVAATAAEIVNERMSPDEKAKAIYQWVVDNTFREPKTRGCGMGDIKFMLESGNLGGKCADINSLFVGLARAAGVPAREVYGVRVANSKQFKILGSSGDISKAHHCRAEYFSPEHGWVAVDPADVRKAVLQEKLPLDDPKILALRNYLFGNWEMNWVGFNTARDFELTPAARGPIPYLMYPYAEIGDRVFDGRDPSVFGFRITSLELNG